MAIRLCVAQLAAVAGDVPGNTARLLATIAERAAEADLIVFPELAITGYGVCGQDEDAEAFRKRAVALVELSEPADGPTFHAVSAAARQAGVAVIYGFAERDGDKRYITMVFVDKSGARLALYRKTHLWDPFRRFEREFFCDGSSAPPVVTFQGVRVGLLICWDVEFPENCRALALQGAQLLIANAANGDRFVLSHVARVRAFENLVHLVYCNAVGAPFCGSSTVCGPTGAPLLSLPESEAVGTVLIEVDGQQWHTVRARNPFFRHRRPELYGPITNTAVAPQGQEQGVAPTS